MTDLCLLGIKYQSDKAQGVGKHNYTPDYHEILSPYRNNIKNMLEIGIGYYDLMVKVVGVNYSKGASLRMWREYFPNAHIHGCDINEECMFEAERITTHLCDQNDRKSLVKTIEKVGTPQFIIDDGSHYIRHQEKSFEVLWKYLENGGIYIIEDIAKKYLERIKGLADNKEDCNVIWEHSTKKDNQGFIAFKKND